MNKLITKSEIPALILLSLGFIFAYYVHYN